MNANLSLLEQVSAQIAEAMGDDFDPQTFWDTLEGETDAVDMLDRLIDWARNSRALAAAAKEMADDAATRSKRLAEREKTLKAAILTILKATGQTKAERPGATVSIQKGRARVVIRDERSVPSQLCKTTVKPDLTAIGTQIKAGEEVPGCALEVGPDTLRMGVK